MRSFAETEIVRDDSLASSVWLRQAMGAAYLVLPDGHVDVVFRKRDTAWTAWLVGPLRRPLLTDSTTDLVIGLRLRLGAARTLVDQPLGDLANRLVDARSLGDRLPPDELLDDIARGSLPLAALARDLDQRRPRAWSPAEQRLVDALGHRRRGRSTAALVGSTDRHLRRMFHELVGLRPSELERIERLRWAVRVRDATRSWASAAADAGYAD